MVSREEVYQAWTEDASTDLSDTAKTHRVPRPVSLGAVAGDGTWRAAAARVDLSRELFQAPAGWSLRSKKADGWLGHRYGRLCVLQDPDGDRLLFLTLDALAGSRWLAEVLGRRFAADGIDVGRVFLSCTHTHGAVGTFFGDLFYDTMGGGLLTRFDSVGVAWLEERLGDAVADALGRLEPVELRAGQGLLPHGQLWQRALGPYLAQVGVPDGMTPGQITQNSRRGVPTGWEPSGVPGSAAERASLRAVEPRVPIFSVHDADGHLLYASGIVHATGSLLTAGAELLSSDVTGAAALGLERALRTPGARRPVVALSAGAHADSNVLVTGQRVAEILEARSGKKRSAETLGRIVLRYVRTASEQIVSALAPAFRQVQPLAADRLEVSFAEAFAPGARLDTRPADDPVGVQPCPLPVRRLPIEWNFGPATIEGSEFSKNEADIDALYTFGARRPLVWMSAHVASVGWSSRVAHIAFPRRAKELLYPPFLPMRLVRLGDVVFVGMPAEPSLRLLDGIEALLPGDRVHLAGNVGAFTGYADTIGSGLMQEYEGSSSYWGRDFGVYLLQQLERLRDAPSFTRARDAPGSGEWLCGGPLLGRGAVGGSAWFSLSPHRHLQAGRTGPGRKLSGRVMGFVAEPRIPIRSALPDDAGVCVRGYWRPENAAVERHGAGRSWPRLADDGPVVVMTMADGSERRSDEDPMVVRWDGDLWQVWAELAEAPVRMRVEGAWRVRPIGADEVLYSG